MAQITFLFLTKQTLSWSAALALVAQIASLVDVLQCWQQTFSMISFA